MFGMLDIFMVVSFTKVFLHTNIVCKKIFFSILVIIHPIELHFKKSSKVNNEDESNLQDENELRNRMIYPFKV